MAQGSDRVAFLGPEGTFTEEALLANMPDGGLHPFPYPSIRDVLRAVQSGEVPLGLVAIENALEGSVPMTLDGLAWGFERSADRARGHAPRASDAHHEDGRCRSTRSPRSSASPHAYGQCRDFIHDAPRQRRARGDRLDRRGGAPRQPREPAVGGRRHAARRRDVRVSHRRRGHRGLRGQSHPLRVRRARARRRRTSAAATRPASSAAWTRTSRAASC